MKMPAFRKLALSSLLALAGFLSFAPSALAQCSVTGISLASTSAASTNCFIPRGTSMRYAITGTWTGTGEVDVSTDGGASFKADTITAANLNGRLVAPMYDDIIARIYFKLASSGTLTGSMTGETYKNSRFTFETVPAGSVAYSSFGTSTASVAGTIYTADLIVGGSTPFLSTGGAVLNGSTASTDNLIYVLYDSAGNVVANTAVAGTLSANANTYQKIAWTSAVSLAPGQYHLGWQGNGTTATARMIAASTFVNVVTSSTTGVFATLPAFVPPTTFIPVVGPIGYIY